MSSSGNSPNAYIENFILVKYGNDACQNKLFSLMVKQLNIFYPKSNIHILTNKKINDKRIITHVVPSLEPNHTCKFRIFSLLTEPAMYIDCDMLILKHFTDKHITNTKYFNLFMSYGKYFHGHFNHNIYNNGIIWVKNPAPWITERLYKINRKYQSLDFFSSDEFAVSELISNRKWAMNEFKEVNQFYNGKNRGAQTVHYILNAKQFLPHDCNRHMRKIIKHI